MCIKSMYLIIMMTAMLNLITWSLIIFFRQRLDELEHTDLATERTINMDEDDNKNHKKKKDRYFSRDHLTESIKQKFCGSYFRIF